MEQEYLVFRLYGPLASWGEIAVGESRHSALYPTKSAVSGLLAAALGIRRDNDALLKEIAEQCQIGIKVISTGTFLSDYHTTQVPKAESKVTYHTRREELVRGREKLGTILSSREYRVDALYLVAVRISDQYPCSAEDLQNALLFPKFHLYLGRKSCPLAAPLKPVVKKGKGFKAVLDEVDVEPLSLVIERKTGEVGTPNTRFLPEMKARYYWEGPGDDPKPDQVVFKNDRLISRKHWQFGKRTEKFFQEKEDESCIFPE
jgi:CRISPR system Cascade subunit CasD